MGSSSKTDLFAPSGWQTNAHEQQRPKVSRINTHFEDFVPVHQVKTWQQVDNEELQQRRAHSLSGIASGGAMKVKKQLKKVITKRAQA